MSDPILHVPYVIFELNLSCDQLSVYLAIKLVASKKIDLFNMRNIHEKLCISDLEFWLIADTLTKNFPIINKPLIFIDEFSNITVYDIWPEHFKYVCTKNEEIK